MGVAAALATRGSSRCLPPQPRDTMRSATLRSVAAGAFRQALSRRALRRAGIASCRRGARLYGGRPHPDAGAPEAPWPSAPGAQLEPAFFSPVRTETRQARRDISELLNPPRRRVLRRVDSGPQEAAQMPCTTRPLERAAFRPAPFRRTRWRAGGCLRGRSRRRRRSARERLRALRPAERQTPRERIAAAVSGPPLCRDYGKCVCALVFSRCAVLLWPLASSHPSAASDLPPTSRLRPTHVLVQPLRYVAELGPNSELV